MGIDWSKYIFNISLIIKNNPNTEDEFSSGTYKLDFEKSYYTITNGYMIIESHNKDTKSVIGQTFELKSIKSYKIWQ